MKPTDVQRSAELEVSRERPQAEGQLLAPAGRGPAAPHGSWGTHEPVAGGADGAGGSGAGRAHGRAPLPRQDATALGAEWHGHAAGRAGSPRRAGGRPGRPGPAPRGPGAHPRHLKAPPGWRGPLSCGFAQPRDRPAGCRQGDAFVAFRGPMTREGREPRPGVRKAGSGHSKRSGVVLPPARGRYGWWEARAGRSPPPLAALHPVQGPLCSVVTARPHLGDARLCHRHFSPLPHGACSLGLGHAGRGAGSRAWRQGCPRCPSPCAWRGCSRQGQVGPGPGHRLTWQHPRLSLAA